MKSGAKLFDVVGGNIVESVGARAGDAPKPAPAARTSDGRERMRDACLIPLELIDPDPDQPRTLFDAEDLAWLADTMRRHGQLQPALVRPSPTAGRWLLISGDRRHRAAGLAGLPRLKCLVAEGVPDPAVLAEQQLIENLCRADLPPLDEANGFQRWLTARPGSTQADCARALGVSEARVSRAMSRLKLAPAVQAKLASGEIGRNVADLIGKLEDGAAQEQLAREAARDSLSAPQVQERVKVQRRKPADDRPPTLGLVGSSVNSRTYNIEDARVSVRFVREASHDEFAAVLEAAAAQARDTARRAAAC